MVLGKEQRVGLHLSDSHEIFASVSWYDPDRQRRFSDDAIRHFTEKCASRSVAVSAMAFMALEDT